MWEISDCVEDSLPSANAKCQCQVPSFPIIWYFFGDSQTHFIIFIGQWPIRFGLEKLLGLECAQWSENRDVMPEVTGSKPRPGSSYNGSCSVNGVRWKRRPNLDVREVGRKSHCLS